MSDQRSALASELPSLADEPTASVCCNNRRVFSLDVPINSTPDLSYHDDLQMALFYNELISRTCRSSNPSKSFANSRHCFVHSGVSILVFTGNSISGNG